MTEMTSFGCAWTTVATTCALRARWAPATRFGLAVVHPRARKAAQLLDGGMGVMRRSILSSIVQVAGRVPVDLAVIAEVGCERAEDDVECRSGAMCDGPCL